MIRNNKKFNRRFFFLLSFLFVSLGLFAQKITVKGVVNDATGEPVIGANVIIKGTSVGTITDFDGNFTLNANAKDVLVVSFIGYKNAEVKVKPNMVITLRDDTQLLDDVVVIGYGAVKKKELTGTVAQVKSEELTKINTSDLGNALQGMVSGVSVTAESGAPGASSNILIRGVTSVSGGNTPLYVVDGVPQEGDPRISPNEVETIDILKDAASCAIYGTRGAAGVILITTKKGSAGAMKVTFDGSFGVKKIVSNDFLMNASEQNYFEIIRNRALKPDLLDDQVILDLYKVPGYFHNNTNLLDQIFIDNAINQNYSLNLSGGGNGLNYSVMMGYFNQGGSIINSGFDRFNTRVNLNYTKGKFSMRGSVGLSVEDTDYSPSGIIVQSIKYYPSQPYIAQDQSFETAGGEEQNRIGYVLQTFFSKDNLRTSNSFANLNAKYTVIKGLDLSAQVSMNESHGVRNQFRPYKEIINQNTGKLISKPEDSYALARSINRNSITWNFGAQYQNTFNKHKITAYAGVTGEEYNFEGFYARKEGVLNNDIEVINGTSINPEAGSDGNYTNKLLGTIARLQYDWKSRYLLSMSMRADASSRFAKENRWGFFPSASVAWNISDEPFFKPLTKVVNNFKLRGSYGTTGNQNFSPYSFYSTVSPGYDYTTGTGSGEYLGLGTTQVKYANPDVKWETSEQYNLGLDLAFLNNKVTLTAEYYSTRKRDMLFPVTLPGSTGSASQLTMNVGNMVNSGYELAAQYRSHIGKFYYNLSGTFSTNTNKITRINGDGTRISAYKWGLVSGAQDVSQVTYIAEGYEAGAFFLYPTDGIINSSEKLAAYQKINPSAKMGDLIYKDTDKDGKITDNDRVYCGSGLPKYEIGFIMQFNYMGFDLYTNFYSALGHEIMNGSRATAFGYGRHKDLVAMYSPVNTDSPIPTYRGDLKSHPNYHADTDLWLEDGSYLRLKNITLGYTLPKSITTKWHLNKFRVYIAAQNLFTLTKYSGYDPEIGGNISTRGMDMGNYPSFTTYSAGINLSF